MQSIEIKGEKHNLNLEHLSDWKKCYLYLLPAECKKPDDLNSRTIEMELPQVLKLRDALNIIIEEMEKK